MCQCGLRNTTVNSQVVDSKPSRGARHSKQSGHPLRWPFVFSSGSVPGSVNDEFKNDSGARHDRSGFQLIYGAIPVTNAQRKALSRMAAMNSSSNDSDLNQRTAARSARMRQARITLRRWGLPARSSSSSPRKSSRPFTPTPSPPFILNRIPIPANGSGLMVRKGYPAQKPGWLASWQQEVI